MAANEAGGTRGLDAVLYTDRGRALALARVRRAPLTKRRGLRFGLTFRFRWIHEGHAVTAAFPFEAASSACARAEDFEWERLGEGAWGGRRVADQKAKRKE